MPIERNARTGCERVFEDHTSGATSDRPDADAPQSQPARSGQPVEAEEEAADDPAEMDNRQTQPIAEESVP